MISLSRFNEQFNYRTQCSTNILIYQLNNNRSLADKSLKNINKYETSYSYYVPMKLSNCLRFRQKKNFNKVWQTMMLILNSANFKQKLMIDPCHRCQDP